jgi:adenosylcobinamide-GDP ribazoletransferase
MEIMRDSRIGSYGALALLLSVVVRMAAMAALGRPGIVAIAMILAGMLGRSGMLLLLLLLPPARDDGMGASMGKPRTEAIALGLGLAMVAAFLSLPGLPAIVAVALGFSSSLVVARLAHMQIGGHTGDLLGASEVITECVVLTVMVSAFSA